MFSISGMVHLRSKALDRTILKICYEVLARAVPSRFRRGLTYLLHVDAVTCAAEDEAGLHRPCKALGLCGVSVCLCVCVIDVGTETKTNIPGWRFPPALLAGN